MSPEDKSALENAILKIEEKNNAYKDEVVKKAVAETDKVTKELHLYKETVDGIVKENTEKGANILQLQEEVKNLGAKQGRMLNDNVGGAKKTVIDLMTKEFKSEKFTELFTKMGKGVINDYASSYKMETKVSNITTGSLASQNYIDYLPWQAGMEPLGQTRIRQFVRTIESDFDNVQFPRANTPPGGGSLSSQTTEGNLKAQVDRGWTMQTLTLYPFAGWAAVSRQSLRNILFLQSWLPISLNEELLDQEDLMFANAIVAAATGSTTATGITVDAELIVYYMKNLIATKFYPNMVAIDPTKWAQVLVTKPSNYSLPNVINISPNGEVRILGTPILPVNWLTGGRILVGDFTKAAIVQSEGLTFRQSENGTSQDFMKNVVTFLIERTEGIAIFRPDAFITAILP